MLLRKNRSVLLALLLTSFLSACVSINTSPDAGRQTAAKSEPEDTATDPATKISLEDAANYNMALGAEYLKKNNVSKAIEKLEKAIMQKPELALAHSYLGFAYEKVDDIDKANVHYLRAVKLDSGDPVAANNYGTFLCRQNKLKESLSYFVRAAENRLYQTPEAAYANAGVCARKIPNNTLAKQYFLKAIQKKSRYPDALWHLADISVAQNNLDEAESFYRSYSILLPKGQDNADQLLLAYRIARASGNMNVASQYAIQLEDKFPNSDQFKQLTDPR